MPRSAIPSATARRSETGTPTDSEGLFAAYQATRSRELRDRLVLLHLDIADRCARRYLRRGEPLDDLTQVSRIALVRAVERFDPSRGTGFEAFAIPTVLGHIRHHFRDNCWAVSAPRTTKELRSRVQRTSERLTQQLGREPTVEEIADMLDVDVARVSTTIDSNRCYRTEPLANSGDEFGAAGARHVSDPDDPCAEDATNRVGATESLRLLDERLRRVVVWRFYEGCTQREIGARLGVGQVQVSRLLSKALDQLRSTLAPT